MKKKKNREPSNVEELRRYLELNNIAEELDDTLIATIGIQVVEDYDRDKESRSAWEELHKEAIKLASLVQEVKSYPYSGAANIKYPLLAEAAIQFSARAYPNIVQGKDVVKGSVTGGDKDGKKAKKASRVSTYMSWQLLEEMPEWEEDMDVLLITLPILGCAFKKTWYDAIEDRNHSEYVSANNLVVHYYARSLDKLNRSTEIVELYPNEIVEQVFAGAFLDRELGEPLPNEAKDDKAPQNDKDQPHVFLEQHRYWDLDGDGYQEPYIITVHRDSGKLVRIVARFDPEDIKVGEDGQLLKINATQYYTQYTFLPSIDGGFYKMGLGTLLTPMNHAVDSVINQLLDAGTLANLQGGFTGKGVNMARGRGRQGGTVTIKPGEWRQLNISGDDLRKGIVPLPFKEPSMALFQLLGMLVEAGRKLGSVTDVLTGEQKQSNVPASTTLALIEQGLKVFTAVYKRVHRSLKKEFEKCHRLNQMFVEDDKYREVLDQFKDEVMPDQPDQGPPGEMPPGSVQPGGQLPAPGTMQPGGQLPVPVEEEEVSAKADFEAGNYDVQPVSDASNISGMMQMVKSQALDGFKGQGLKDDVIVRRQLEALQIPDIDELVYGEGEQRPQDPQLMIEQAKMDQENKKLEVEEANVNVKLMELKLNEKKIHFQALKDYATAVDKFAEAEAREPGQQLEYYKTHVDSLAKMIKAESDAAKPAPGAPQPAGGGAK